MVEVDQTDSILNSARMESAARTGFRTATMSTGVRNRTPGVRLCPGLIWINWISGLLDLD